MISAKEARKQSEQNKQDILNKEMTMIEKEINNEISQGNNNVYINGSISLIKLLDKPFIIVYNIFRNINKLFAKVAKL